MCRPESNTLTRYTERNWRLLPARASLSASAPAADDGGRTPERPYAAGPEPTGRHPKPRIHPIGRRQCTASGTRETAPAVGATSPVPLAASTPPRPSKRAAPSRASRTLPREPHPPARVGLLLREPDSAARAASSRAGGTSAACTPRRNAPNVGFARAGMVIVCQKLPYRGADDTRSAKARNARGEMYCLSVADRSWSSLRIGNVCTRRYRSAMSSETLRWLLGVEGSASGVLVSGDS
jgi:hypothetical protein